MKAEEETDRESETNAAWIGAGSLTPYNDDCISCYTGVTSFIPIFVPDDQFTPFLSMTRFSYLDLKVFVELP